MSIKESNPPKNAEHTNISPRTISCLCALIYGGSFVLGLNALSESQATEQKIQIIEQQVDEDSGSMYLANRKDQLETEKKYADILYGLSIAMGGFALYGGLVNSKKISTKLHKNKFVL